MSRTKIIENGKGENAQRWYMAERKRATGEKDDKWIMTSGSLV
jgi:hypothetical protein